MPATPPCGRTTAALSVLKVRDSAQAAWEKEAKPPLTEASPAGLMKMACEPALTATPASPMPAPAAEGGRRRKAPDTVPLSEAARAAWPAASSAARIKAVMVFIFPPPL